MSSTRALYRGGLVAIALSSCTAAPWQNGPAPRPTSQNAVQTIAARASSENGTHDAQQWQTIPLESLPHDHFNVDWGRAVREGYISPKGSIDADIDDETSFNLDVVLRFEDLLVRDVLFSHAAHTYWINCETCHPKIFVPHVGANKMTMRDIQEGKYCGRCHGIVAFPTTVMSGPHFRDNCLKCHTHGKR